MISAYHIGIGTYEMFINIQYTVLPIGRVVVICSIIENPGSNFGYTVGNGNISKAGTPGERIRTNSGDVIGNSHTCEILVLRTRVKLNLSFFDREGEIRVSVCGGVYTNPT